MIRALIAQLAYRWAAIIGAGIWEDAEDEWPDGHANSCACSKCYIAATGGGR